MPRPRNDLSSAIHSSWNGRVELGSGEYYEGDIFEGLPHGLGKGVYNDGGQYFGEWQSGVFHGLGVLQVIILHEYITCNIARYHLPVLYCLV